tara:strand:+ start:555 stop:1490 length:936 start_codon:yes stop_codon:yes gene_type:complete
MNLKKPKFWDYKEPNIYAYLLLPLTYLVKILNYLNYKFSKRNLKRTGIKTICIGNIYVGGTGKTSLSIKINEILNKQEIKSCFIKKFYKTQLDEQKLLNSRGKLFLSAERRDAIYEAEKQNYKVAICDDGLQDRSINYDLKFVCFNSINWIGNGMTLPSGPLRENINNLKNYEHVFINGNLENLEEIKKQIFKINPQINIYFGIYEPINITEFKKDDKYIVFSGIGNHKTFVSMIQNYKLTILKDIEFPDHYKYNKKDINKILDYANQLNCKIITTEKDFLRLENIENEKIKYLKSELKILNEEKLLSLLV